MFLNFTSIIGNPRISFGSHHTQFHIDIPYLYGFKTGDRNINSRGIVSIHSCKSIKESDIAPFHFGVFIHHYHTPTPNPTCAVSRSYVGFQIGYGIVTQTILAYIIGYLNVCSIKILIIIHSVLSAIVDIIQSSLHFGIFRSIFVLNFDSISGNSISRSLCCCYSNIWSIFVMPIYTINSDIFRQGYCLIRFYIIPKAVAISTT